MQGKWLKAYRREKREITMPKSSRAITAKSFELGNVWQTPLGFFYSYFVNGKEKERAHPFRTQDEAIQAAQNKVEYLKAHPEFHLNKGIKRVTDKRSRWSAGSKDWNY
jgi:hypothetical protein